MLWIYQAVRLRAAKRRTLHETEKQSIRASVPVLIQATRVDEGIAPFEVVEERWACIALQRNRHGQFAAFCHAEPSTTAERVIAVWKPCVPENNIQVGLGRHERCRCAGRQVDVLCAVTIMTCASGRTRLMSGEDTHVGEVSARVRYIDGPALQVIEKGC